MPVSVNAVSLERAQHNFAECGAAERRNVTNARDPVADESREEGWRPLDSERDNVEEPQSGIKYGNSYPLDDTTVLYYWRSTYWHRLVS